MCLSLMLMLAGDVGAGLVVGAQNAEGRTNNDLTWKHERTDLNETKQTSGAITKLRY